MFRLIKLFPIFLMVPLMALKPVGHVNDFAKIYSQEYRVDLERKLSSMKDVEVAVVTLPTLEGKGVETVARELFDEWGIGKKGTDSGVLLLVGMQEREIRLEIGYGLEGVLPDGVCGRIIRNDLVPHFAKGKFEAGTSKAINEIVERVHGEFEEALEEGELDLARGILFALALIVVVIYLFMRAGFFPHARRYFPRNYGGFSSGGSGGFGGFGGFGGGSGGGGGASGRF